jgi:hypothetical protein
MGTHCTWLPPGHPNQGDVVTTDRWGNRGCQDGPNGDINFTSTFSGGTWTHLAVGINSGMNNLPNGQCRSTEGGTNITYHYPLSVTMPAFNSMFGVQLW